MKKAIKEVVKGQTPTLLEADKANEIIKALNMLMNIEIVESTTAGVFFSHNKIILQIPTRKETQDLTYCVTDEVTKETYTETKTFYTVPKQ